MVKLFLLLLDKPVIGMDYYVTHAISTCEKLRKYCPVGDLCSHMEELEGSLSKNLESIKSKCMTYFERPSSSLFLNVDKEILYLDGRSIFPKCPIQG
jgi:hypothetical protein